MLKKVAVFFGGKSEEREISILTGCLALKLIDPSRFIPVPVYIHTDGGFYTFEKTLSLETFQKQPFSLSSFLPCFFDRGELVTLNKKHKILRRDKIDVALNCCHGGAGENGGVAALCEQFSILSASPSVAACAVCMDKEWTKLFLRAAGVPVLPYAVLTRGEYVRRGALSFAEAKKSGFPLIVKPASSGSSFGIEVVFKEEDLKGAVERAFMHGEKLIFEPYLQDKEDINCAAFRLKGKVCVSEAERAFGAGVYGFQEKYLTRRSYGGAGEDAPSSTPNLTEEEREKIRAYTSAAYKRLETLGVVRVDFLKSEKGIVAGEINAVPGSLAYYLFGERLADGRRFLTDLLEEPFFGCPRDIEIAETGVLQNASFGGKRGFSAARL